MTSIAMILRFVMFFALLSIIALAVAQKISIHRMKRQLLGKTPVRYFSMFYHIDPKSVPNTPRGREFLKSVKRLNIRTLMLIALLLAVIAAARITLGYL